MKLYLEEITGNQSDTFDIDVIETKTKDISSKDFFWLVNAPIGELGYQIINTIKKGPWDFQLQIFSVDRKKTGGTYQVKLTQKVEFREDEEIKFLKRNENIKKATKRIEELSMKELMIQKKTMEDKLNNKDTFSEKEIEELKLLRVAEDEIAKRTKDIENCLLKNKIEPKDRDALLFLIKNCG